MSRVMPLPYREMQSPVPCCRAWQLGQCTVFAGKEPPGWHMSISHPTRYPTWDEIREARYRFVPDAVTMVMILPPRAEYVNVHRNCFHLHEMSGGPVEPVGIHRDDRPAIDPILLGHYAGEIPIRAARK